MKRANVPKPTDEWYTPLEVVQALGRFDLDPCAAPGHNTADHLYTKEDDGLSREWFGRVWLNPPYSQPLIKQFVAKLAEHGNGIALLFNNCDNVMFFDTIFPEATAIKFLRKRIRFIRPDGSQGDRPSRGSVLVAFGEENAISLKESPFEGTFIWLNRNCDRELTREDLVEIATPYADFSSDENREEVLESYVQFLEYVTDNYIIIDRRL